MNVIRISPNHRASGKAGFMPPMLIRYHLPGLPEPDR